MKDRKEEMKEYLEKAFPRYGLLTTVFPDNGKPIVVGMSRLNARLVIEPIEIDSKEGLIKFYSDYDFVIVSSLVRIVSALGYVDDMEHRTIDLSVEHMLKTDTYVPPGLITQMMAVNGLVVQDHKKLQMDKYLSMQALYRLPYGDVNVTENMFSILKGVCVMAEPTLFIDFQKVDYLVMATRSKMLAAVDYLLSLGVVLQGKGSRKSMDSLLEIVELTSDIKFKRRWRSKSRSLYCTDFIGNEIVESDARLKALVDYDFDSVFFSKWIMRSIVDGLYSYKESNFTYGHNTLDLMWSTIRPLIIGEETIREVVISTKDFGEQVKMAEANGVAVSGKCLYLKGECNV